MHAHLSQLQQHGLCHVHGVQDAVLAALAQTVLDLAYKKRNFASMSVGIVMIAIIVVSIVSVRIAHLVAASIADTRCRAPFDAQSGQTAENRAALRPNTAAADIKCTKRVQMAQMKHAGVANSNAATQTEDAQLAKVAQSSQAIVTNSIAMMESELMQTRQAPPVS